MCHIQVKTERKYAKLTKLACSAKHMAKNQQAKQASIKRDIQSAALTHMM